MTVAIYCGSAFGNNEIYENTAKLLAQKLSKENINIVYGGSVQGLMGIVSNEAMSLGNIVTGVITYDLSNKEIENKNISKIYKVNTINERKEKMEELADAFIVLPGGYGTFEEIFEVLSNAQIGYHKKPCAFLNVMGFYDPLLSMIQATVRQGFTHSRFADTLLVSDQIETLLAQFAQYQPPQPKWGMNEIVA